MSGSGLSRHLPPALSHSFLALCFCFCSCSLFSALQSLSPLCPELSRGFPLTLRKSQSFYMGPQSSQRCPRPRLCQLPAPNAHLCSSHVEFPAPPGNCWGSAVRASALGLALSGMFFPDTCMAHCFASSSLFSSVPFSVMPYLDTPSPKSLFLFFTSFFSRACPTFYHVIYNLLVLFFCLPP